MSDEEVLYIDHGEGINRESGETTHPEPQAVQSQSNADVEPKDPTNEQEAVIEIRASEKQPAEEPPKKTENTAEAAQPEQPEATDTAEMIATTNAADATDATDTTNTIAQAEVAAQTEAPAEAEATVQPVVTNTDQDGGEPLDKIAQITTSSGTLPLPSEETEGIEPLLPY